MATATDPICLMQVDYYNPSSISGRPKMPGPIRG